jgi:hypothetical protein
MSRYVRPTKRTKRKYNRYKKCGKMFWNDASRALTIAKSVRNMVNVEWKQHTVNGGVFVDSGPNEYPLTNIPRGDTKDKRDGASCRIKWFTFNYRIRIHPSSDNCCVRVMVVLDNQTNQAQFTSTDLLANPSEACLSGLNLDNSGRFRIIYNKVHVLTSTNSLVNRRVYKKIDCLLKFDNNVGDITDLTRKSMSLVLVSDVSSNLPTFNYEYRCRFIDN